jgi:hypothetical protein
MNTGSDSGWQQTGGDSRARSALKKVASLKIRCARFLAPLLAIALPVCAVALPDENPALAPWTRGVRIGPVVADPARHTIHAYYVANPESPDGKYVLYFSSTDLKGEFGDICILERATGSEIILAKNVQTEDAHRAACQQWVSGGKLVAFHEVVEGNKWRVVVVDVASGEKNVIAVDRQLGFGSPNGNLLPLYGCHWNPGEHRDLELWDAETGKIRKAVLVSDVLEKCPGLLKTDASPASIFFPVLSPDLTRVMFKLAYGKGGDDFRSKTASAREGLVCYDLATGKFLRSYPKWGHPAWHPDSRRILQVGYQLFDTDTGDVERKSGLPNLKGTHLTLSPDARLMAVDGALDVLGKAPQDWGIVVADGNAGEWRLIHEFNNLRGARSWRRSHPHPVFSADGRRIYYNVSDGPFTRLHVAQAGGVPSPPK